MGQKPVGEQAWRRLLSVEGPRLQVAGLVTNVESERVWWRSNGIAQDAAGRPIIDNADRNVEAILHAIERFRVSLIIAVQHPWILPATVLEAVGYRALNFHSAPLPAYKGYNAANHAILAGDHRFACTAHWMAEEVDAGDTCFECLFDIADDETALSLYAKAHHANLRLLDTVLDHLQSGRPLPRRPTRRGGAFYRRTSIDALREVKPGTDDLERRGRALFFPPFEPAYVRAGDRKIYLIPASAWPRLSGSTDALGCEILRAASTAFEVA